MKTNNQNTSGKYIPASEDASQDSEWVEFYRGLQSFSEHSFPRECPLCKKTFSSAEDFLFGGTEGVFNTSGLRQARDDDDKYVVELFRNCTCGSTLLEFFKDRRDTSANGKTKRKLFGRLMRRLEKAGLSTEVARRELLTIMTGGDSAILKKLGIKVRFRKLRATA
jgi:hypothetical protein